MHFTIQLIQFLLGSRFIFLRNLLFFLFLRLYSFCLALLRFILNSVEEFWIGRTGCLFFYDVFIDVLLFGQNNLSYNR